MSLVRPYSTFANDYTSKIMIGSKFLSTIATSKSRPHTETDYIGTRISQ